MITAKELLEKGWKKHFSFEYDTWIWRHPQCWFRDYQTRELIMITHTLAQARWAQEHIVDKCGTYIV